MAISPVSHPSMSELIDQIASDATLEQAYHWLCKRREKLSYNNDVWNLRRHWRQKKQELQQTLLRGEFRFSPQVEVRLPDGKLECWCALDSLVLKAMTIVLGVHLAPVISPSCVHIKGNGGAKKAVREVFHALSPTSHVMKSDVKGYYASIDHMLLFDMLSEFITNRYLSTHLS